MCLGEEEETEEAVEAREEEEEEEEKREEGDRASPLHSHTQSRLPGVTRRLTPRAFLLRGRDIVL